MVATSTDSFAAPVGAHSGPAVLDVSPSMVLYAINPLKDERWSEFLIRHPRASAFHATPWLNALQQTYGYTPIAYTTSPPGERLRDGLLFCKIDSWITGRRLVSLPFSDHCEPLVEQQHDLEAILALVAQLGREQKLRYVEIRPRFRVAEVTGPFKESDTYFFHEVDLSPNLDAVFKKFNKDSTQRKIRRAEREGLTLKSGNSQALLDDFLRLNLSTRRKHHLPPQPRSWFQNLIACFGDALTIYLAYKGETPVAAILTIRFKDALVYKYGCSDAQFSNLGGMQMVFWKAIEHAKSLGLRSFDLGRSDTDNAGLNTFKDRWGAEKSTLAYLRCPEGKNQIAGNSWKIRVAKQIFDRTPDSLLSAIGSVMYKHIG